MVAPLVVGLAAGAALRAAAKYAAKKAAKKASGAVTRKASKVAKALKKPREETGTYTKDAVTRNKPGAAKRTRQVKENKERASVGLPPKGKTTVKKRK